MSDQPILQIRDLCKDFKVRSAKLFEGPKQLHALSHVSLDIQKGETLGVIGESGCGKSTLGRCVVGLHSVTSGDIIYKEKPEGTAYQRRTPETVTRIFRLFFRTRIRP